MRNLKYSLLLSASLLVNVQICWAMIEEDTVSHEFGSNSISYRKGRFEPSSEGSTLYTTPHIPGGIIQSKQVDNNISECLPIKTIPMQVGKNQDERVQITQTTDYPHRIHGQLKIRYGKIGAATATGILVGPHHVLTAGHNIYNDFSKTNKWEWANNISVHLGLNESLEPFEARKVVKAYTFRQWVKDRKKSYDMALLLLDDSIGDKIGWGGLLSLSDQETLGETITVTGYPGDKGGTKMMAMSHKVSEIKPEEIYYNMYTHKGQSGGGIWIKKLGIPYVLGIHTNGGIKEGVGHSGARLSPYKFEKVTGWISQTYALDKTYMVIDSSSLINNQYDPEDIFNFAVKYETGEGVQVDKNTAIILYELAANQGHAGALCKFGDFFRVGGFFYKGKIIPQNLEKAIQLYKRSAQKNYAEAQFKLGWMYENGQCVLQDQQVALKWYKLAKKQGNGEAISRIQALESDLSINISPKSIIILRDMSNRIKLASPPELERNTQSLTKNTNTKKRTLQTPTKKVNKRSKKYIQHMKSLENQPKITQYLIPILKVNAN